MLRKLARLVRSLFANSEPCSCVAEPASFVRRHTPTFMLGRDIVIRARTSSELPPRPEWMLAPKPVHVPEYEWNEKAQMLVPTDEERSWRECIEPFAHS